MKEVNYKGYDCYEFNIKVTMNKRWIPYFLSFLNRMEYYGSVGASRLIAFYSDGDGDFRPKFECEIEPPDMAVDPKSCKITDLGFDPKPPETRIESIFDAG